MKNSYTDEKERYSKPKFFSFQSVVILILCFALCVSIKPAIENIIIMNDQFHYSEYLKKLEQQKNEKGISSIANINSDFLGWLEIDDVNISLPIVKTESEQDENYYLNHDFKREKNSLGCPYQVHDMSIDDYNTMFIGHSAFNTMVLGNTNYQSLFGKLNDYLSTSNAYNYNIKFETTTKTYNYKIFGVFRFNIKDTTTEKYKEVVNSIYSNSISSQSSYDSFISCIKKYSILDCGDDFEFGDKFLTLFTCYSNLDYRTIIVAKQI